ncbi:MAG: hypothetical protein ACTSYI_08380 [Promethearchaeota archaeon]
MNQSYFENVPEFVIDFYKSIKNPFRIKILTLLYNSGKLSLSELESKTEKPTGYIYSHIHKLENLYMVQNFIKKQEKSRIRSFYKLTEIGKQFFRFFLVLKSGKLISTKIDEDVIKSLASKIRFSILFQLIGTEGMSFSKLQEDTGLKSSVLNHHLHSLTKSYLIQNYLKKEENSSNYSFYKITEIGEDIVSTTIKVYNLSMSKKQCVEDFLNDYIEINVTNVNNENSEKLISTQSSSEITPKMP